MGSAPVLAAVVVVMMALGHVRANWEPHGSHGGEDAASECDKNYGHGYTASWRHRVALCPPANADDAGWTSSMRHLATKELTDDASTSWARCWSAPNGVVVCQVRGRAQCSPRTACTASADLDSLAHPELRLPTPPPRCLHSLQAPDEERHMCAYPNPEPAPYMHAAPWNVRHDRSPSHYNPKPNWS
jgi:hypothetical protein